MLTSEVINTSAIALAATNNASNAVPYLGLQFFPEMKKAGLDLKWIKTHKGLPVTLKASNFDALPALRTREGVKIEKTQMAFFRETMQITEEDEQEIGRADDENDPYLKSALQSVYDDTNALLSGAEVVPERMRMSLLATTEGHPSIGIESDGVKYEYDYDPNGEYAAKHYLKLEGTSDWSDTENSKPLTDLNNARKALAKLGKIASYVLMNSNTFEYLLNNKQVKNAILAQNLTANIEMTEENVVSIVRSRTKLSIVLYDKMYMDENKNDQYFYPDNKVTLLPAGALGKTWFGTTPEERTASQVADVDVSMYGVGIAIAKKVEYGPPAVTSVTASEIVLPSYENMDSTFVIKVSTKYTYEAVSDASGNPKEQGWYEKSGNDYVLTSDESVTGSKTYYTRKEV
nr:MAG TPA: capsid protein [Caudoviricetes sp.]